MSSSHPEPHPSESRPSHDAWAAGHLGDLSDHLPTELVDEALNETGAVQKRCRSIPSRVVVYFVIALSLFTTLGYGQVFTKLGLGGRTLTTVSASALAQARRRLGVAPMRRIFQILRGPVATVHRQSSWYRGLRLCAVDGTVLSVPDSMANRQSFLKHPGRITAGYPHVRLVAVIACGTRSIIDAVFGTAQTGENEYFRQLFPSLGPGMLILADRNFDGAALLRELADTGADFLVRIRKNKVLPLLKTLPDGSFISQIGALPVRVLSARITVQEADGSSRCEIYRWVTTLCRIEQGDTAELARIYHQRWEIETCFREMKSSLLDGAVLRSKNPQLVEQEIYGLLIAEQLLRTVMSEATNQDPWLDPDRASFVVALNAVRDSIILEPETVSRADQSSGWARLAGRVGARIMNSLLLPRRSRSGSRTVKRAASKYQARVSRLHQPTVAVTIVVDVVGVI